VRFIRFFLYVCKHKAYVFWYACKLGIPWRGLVHDWTKFLPDEFGPHSDFFFGDWRYEDSTTVTFTGTDIITTEDIKREELDKSWLRHQHRSGHHWQRYISWDDNGNMTIHPMPDAYRKEMLADWLGAHYSQGKPDIHTWYKKHGPHIKLHPETRAWVEKKLEEL